MKTSFQLLDSLSLRITDQAADVGPYPTKRLQKGLLLADGEHDLAEEGVGFGVPVLKKGGQTVFPGGLELVWERSGAAWEVRAVFVMNLVERLARRGGGRLRSEPLYAVKDSLAALHRRSPALRGLLTATSTGLRRAFGWQTTYEETELVGTIAVTCMIYGEKGRLAVAVDLTGLDRDGLTEVVVMNEQGARSFDRYRDSDGTALAGSRIGAWHEVRGAEACFVSRAHGVSFSLQQAEGAQLYRGRELIGSRLAWSGFGYALAPTRERFEYDVAIARTG
jgi:hypothetical protein